MKRQIHEIKGIDEKKKKEFEEMRNTNRELEFLDDDSMMTLQNCGVNISNLIVDFELGLWRTGLTCPDIIDWYMVGEDFTMTEKTGELSVSREETEDTSTAYERTTSGKVTHTRSVTIKPTFGSRLVQKFMDIQIRNSALGMQGRLFQNYSDGGIHMRVTIRDVSGDFSMRETALNVKLESFIDTFMIDLTDNEGEAELSLMVEFDPIYEIIGNLFGEFAIPTNAIAPTITNGGITESAGVITISALTLSDPDVYAFDEFLYLKAYDSDTGSQLNTDKIDVSAGSVDYTHDYGITAGTNIVFQFGYNLGGNIYYIELEEYTSVGTRKTTTKDKKGE